MDFDELTKWTYNSWNIHVVFDCFDLWDKPDHAKQYWSNKFNANIITFYLSLDNDNRKIFIDHINNLL